VLVDVPPAVAELFGDSLGTIGRYVDILASRGIDWGLIGPREGHRLWDRHVLNSVAAAGLVPEGVTVVDVGSGAGLPGIPLAVLRPDLRVTLLESLQRRVAFLELAVTELGLSDRVRVIRGRAEEHRERYDVVVSRAVAPLPRLLGWCAPLVASGGRLVALKGSSARVELEAARVDLRRAGFTGEVVECPVTGTDEVTWAIVATRSATR
jgi:16S rRNA (guanine527-N7)-methyltransferase